MDHHYGSALDVGALLKKEQNKEDAAKSVVVEAPKPQIVKKDELNKKQQKYLSLILASILIIFSVWILSQPDFLYNIENGVRNAAIAQYRSAALNEVSQTLPELSSKQKAAAAEVKVQEMSQSAEFSANIKSISDNYKSFYRDEQGQTFLYNNDPYYYFRLAKNLVEFGMLGDIANKDISGNVVVKDSLRNFPSGDLPGFNLFPYALFYFFKVWTRFDSSVSLLTTTFYFPVFVGALSVLLIFLIARKFADDWVGFITAFLFSLHPIFLFWNYGGYADTQVLAMFWSLLSVFLFVYLIDLSNKKRAFLSAILLVPVLYFANDVWQGLFFVPAMFVVFFAVLFAVSILHHAFAEKKKFYFIVLAFVLIAGIFVVRYIVEGYSGRILSFLNLNVQTSILPTGFSSVIELEGAMTFGRFVGALGGGLFVFAFVIELFFIAKKIFKNEEKQLLLPVVWFVVMAVPSFLSARFLFFVLPPFVLLSGRGFWRLSKSIEHLLLSGFRLRIKKEYAKIIGVVVVFAIILFVLNPDPQVAKTKLPSISKSVYDVSKFISANSGKDAVIASWWGAGYALSAFSKRATFFDGGLFNTPRLYWISRALSTNNETASANILKMVSCGFDEGLNGLFDSWSNSPENILLFQQMLEQPRQFANKTLSKLDMGYNSVYCNKTSEIFVVVTQDMLYQQHLFDYYSAWDFRSAGMRSAIKGLSQQNATAILQSRYNLSEDQAESAYFDALSFTDKFVPEAVSEIVSCKKSVDNKKLFCPNDFVVDIDVLNASSNGVHPASVVFIKDGKKKVVKYAKSPVQFSIVVYAVDGKYKSFFIDSSLVDKMVVRMFVGDSFDNFEKVFVSKETPSRIVVYKMKQLKKS